MEQLSSLPQKKIKVDPDDGPFHVLADLWNLWLTLAGDYANDLATQNKMQAQAGAHPKTICALTVTTNRSWSAEREAYASLVKMIKTLAILNVQLDVDALQLVEFIPLSMHQENQKITLVVRPERTTNFGSHEYVIVNHD